MMAVIFEVWPAEGRREDYLRLAAELRDELVKMDGFISVERFESLYEQGKLLSLQFWRDEAAITAWRTHLKHGRPRPSDGMVCLLTTGCASRRWCETTGLKIGCRLPLTRRRRSQAEVLAMPRSSFEQFALRHVV